MRIIIFLLFLLLATCTPVSTAAPTSTSVPWTATVTPSPTETPEPTATPSGFQKSPDEHVQVYKNGKYVDLKGPLGVEGNVVWDGKDNPRFVVDVPKGFQGMEKGIAELFDGEWVGVDFRLSLSAESLQMAIDVPNNYYRPLAKVILR